MPLKASIVGITGYTGLETLRFLLAHPEVEIGYLTSRQHEDVVIGEVFPHLSHLDLRVTNTDHNTVGADSDVVFLGLPHKTAQDVVADLHRREEDQVVGLQALAEALDARWRDDTGGGQSVFRQPRRLAATSCQENQTTQSASVKRHPVDHDAVIAGIRYP